MTDPVPPDPAPPPPPPFSGPAGIALIGAGIALMAVGQTVLRNPAMAYAGLAILAVGVVLGVMSQRGK
ncbi:MAG: hypothetical protein HY859_15465 [Caulobacterales bacterium]|nr:hypothetical protein [Caulobacterales bacterium]